MDVAHTIIAQLGTSTGRLAAMLGAFAFVGSYADTLRELFERETGLYVSL